MDRWRGGESQQSSWSLCAPSRVAPRLDEWWESEVEKKALRKADGGG